jgi:hypothetical protein
MFDLIWTQFRALLSKAGISRLAPLRYRFASGHPCFIYTLAELPLKIVSSALQSKTQSFNQKQTENQE